MAIRALSHTESLDRVWEELVYTEARLQNDPQAKDLAPAIGALIKQTETTRQEQRTTWREEILSQAGVDAADDTLDDEVTTLSREILNQVKGDRKHTRYTRYFSKTPTSTIRLGLQSELLRVESWPASLQGDESAAIQALGVALDATLAQAKVALAERTRAATARADYRVRNIVRLIDDVNAARLSLYGLLAQRAAANALGRAWPDRFFRHITRKPKAIKAGTIVSEVEGESEG